MPHTLEILATTLFAISLVHSFSVKRFEHWASKFRQGSVGENFFHLFGEVEVVFGIWAAVFVVCMWAFSGAQEATRYLESLNFTEALFVFVIMAVCSTRPILHFANTLITTIARLLPFSKNLSFYFVALTVGPLLGSLITEAAAMTLIALILKERFFDQKPSESFLYATLAVLFVNVSIGGTLSNFAAPPVLMVASKWNWDNSYMFQHFGYKAFSAVIINALALSLLFRREITKEFLNQSLLGVKEKRSRSKIPAWVMLLNLGTLGLVVMASHYSVVFVGLFLLFLGFCTITKEYQDEVKLREALLVGFFLGGLVVLGTPQKWWLQPLLQSLSEPQLFIGATALTAITDNAALTFLGSQVENLSESMKYALVAGSVTGGGLTVIANAPNPAGFGILKSSFGPEGISPLSLLLYALLPTLVAGLALYFLPSF